MRFSLLQFRCSAHSPVSPPVYSCRRYLSARWRIQDLRRLGFLGKRAARSHRTRTSARLERVRHSAMNGSLVLPWASEQGDRQIENSGRAGSPSPAMFPRAGIPQRPRTVGEPGGMRVRTSGWLAVCAVRIELCSGSNSLITGNPQGIFLKSDPRRPIPALLGSGNRSYFSRVPYSAEQGIFRRLQGLLGDQQRMFECFRVLCDGGNDPEIQHSLAELRIASLGCALSTRSALRTPLIADAWTSDSRNMMSSHRRPCGNLIQSAHHIISLATCSPRRTLAS